MRRISAVWCLSPNVGDALTPWLIRKLGLYGAAWVPPGYPAEHYVITGSVLNWSSKQSMVWGAGLASWKDEVCPEADIRAVRGPLSLMRAKSCGWAGPRFKLAVGDPALLLPKLVKPSPKKYAYGIIPHYVDVARFSYADDRAAERGAVVIDPLLPVEEFCGLVSSCERVVSSSLHGLIVADAYGVLSSWAKFGDGIGGDGMKYWDYLASVGRATITDPPAYMDLRQIAVDEVLERLERPMSYTVADGVRILSMQRELIETCPFIHATVHKELMR